jgi:hypothetical protein
MSNVTVGTVKKSTAKATVLAVNAVARASR